MKTLIFLIIFLNVIAVDLVICKVTNEINYNDNPVLPAKSIFLQSNNIHTVIMTDGILNFDKNYLPGGAGGFIWPASSNNRLIYSSGIWIGAKVILPGNQKELRLAASMYGTHYSQGNIPVMGSVPPVSVCNDSAFNGYLVSVTDQSLVNGGVRTKVAGGHTYTFIYSPWSAWPVEQGAPYIEVNGIPGYQPGWNLDRPGNGVNNSRPADMIFSVFMDYTNCTNDLHHSELSLPGGSLPLGVEIQQLAYAYLTSGMLNSYFVSYKIINKSGKNWDSTYFSLVNDCDIGYASDDVVGCDSIKNTAYTYSSVNNDPIYGDAPPAVGYKVIQGPIIYTGLNTDTVKLPCYNKIGYRMIKMSGHNRFLNSGLPCNGDPDNYVNAYNYMQGKDGCGATLINPITGNPTKYVFERNTNWNDYLPGDKRNIINTGPFNMSAGDTQFVLYAYASDRGNSNLISIYSVLDAMEYADNFYYDCNGTIGIEPIGNIIPRTFQLEQNYPNPFNPETNINFSIAQSSNVKLVIYDVTGREVCTLADEKMQPGIYNLKWDASNYPSGVYFYRMITESFSESKKMILIK